jgi:RNA polymerase sigma factor (sigma-70 family)
MRLFRSPFEQEEAVQEVFLHLYRARETIDPLRLDTLEQYVLTIARRKLIDVWRARAGDARHEELREEHWTDELNEPEAHVANSELRELMERFEDRLKPSYRAFFRAVFVEGRDFDEARQAVGIGALRAKYLKKVLLLRLRRHAPLREFLDRQGAGK